MLSTTYADTFQNSSKDNINQKYNNGPFKGHQNIIKRILIVLCIKNKYVLKLLKKLLIFFGKWWKYLKLTKS